jgi:O-antigen/teichoic acid export membrane protein
MLVSKKTANNIALYSIANYLHTAINAVSNIFVSNILGPTYNGVISYYNAINTNVDQVVFSTFRSSVERDVPQIEGAEQKFKYAQQAFVLNFISAVLFSLFFVIYGLQTTDHVMSMSAYMMAVFNLVRCYSDFYRVWNKSLNKIPLVSIIMIITSLLIPVFAVLFSYLFSIEGFWIGRILLQAITLFCFLFVSKEFFRLCKPNFSVLKQIFVSGGEIVIFALFVSGIQTMDKYFVKGALGLEALGYYAIGSMVFMMLMLVPSSVTGAVYPRFVGMVHENLKDKIKKYSIYIELLCVLVALIVYIIIPYLIEWFMPKYVNSIGVVRILLIAFVSYASVQLRYIDIIRKKNMKQLITRALVAFVIGLLCFIIVSRTDSNMSVYAWVTSLCFVFLGVGVNLAWGKTYDYCLGKRLYLVLIALFPAVCMIPMFVTSLTFLTAMAITVAICAMYYGIRIKIIKE